MRRTATGQIYDRSDKTASQRVEYPTIPHDFVATIYNLLGIAPNSELIDQLNRPRRLVAEGRVLSELFA